jgi:hypothetical protein
MRHHTLVQLTSQILLAVAVGYAQSPPSQPRVVACNEGQNCIHRYVDGQLFKILTGPDGTVIAVSLIESANNKYFRLSVGVLNGTSGIYDVVPSDFTVEATGYKPKTLYLVPAEAIVRTIERERAWANELDWTAAVFSRSTTRTTIRAYSSDGSYATARATTTGPNYGAQAQASENIQARNANAGNQEEQLLATSLRRNTLSPGEQVGGFIYFKSATANTLRVHMPIAGTDYVLEF